MFSHRAFYYGLLQLGSEKQDLVEQTLILKEHLQHFEAQLADDSVRLQRRLMVELGLCFSNLQSLVQICMQRVNGEQPNMSILLGIKSTKIASILFVLL